MHLTGKTFVRSYQHKNRRSFLYSVSLKSRFGIVDVHRIVSDIRRRVEHEITFEGTERRIECVFSSPL